MRASETAPAETVAADTLPAGAGPEAALVERAADGDREAYGLLVEERWSSLVRLARSVVGPEDAEDVVQDSLVHAWSKLTGLEDAERFRSWIGRLVLRRCLRHCRRRWSWLPLESAPEPALRRDPDGEIDLARILATLAPRQRAVMHLTVVEGMSDGEIGDLLGIAAASVRSHRRRARSKLARGWPSTEEATA